MINPRGFAPIFILILGTAILTGIGGGGYYLYNQHQLRSVTDFESCAKLYPVLASYPGQCNTPDSRHFVQELSKEEQKRLMPLKTNDEDFSASSSGNSSSKLLDKTTNWVTFKSNLMGLSFEYPKEWKVNSFNEHIGKLLLESTPGVVEVDVSLFDASTTPEGFFENDDRYTVEKNRIELGGREALENILTWENGDNSTSILMLHEGKMLQIYFPGYMINEKERIVHSFKFLDK